MDISSRIGLLFFIVYPTFYYYWIKQSLLSIFTTSIYVTSILGIVEIQGTGEVTNPNSSKSNIYRDISLHAKWR